MRFLDANIFIYAYYKTDKTLTPTQKTKKEEAKRIIEGINKGEFFVITSVVHLSEIANILKHAMPIEDLLRLISDILMRDNCEVVEVTPADYLSAIELGKEYDLDPNDALAIQIMQERGISEIYSFDSDFRKIREIKVLPKVD